MKSQAISSIMAALLLVAMAVSLSVILSVWSQTALANSMQVSSSITSKSPTGSSAITIESVVTDNTTKSMTLTVRNIGLSTIYIRSITVENSRGFFHQVNENASLPKTVAETYTIFNLSFKYRDFYTVKVFTFEGASDIKTLFVDA